MTEPTPLEIQTQAHANVALICLHGLGADGAGLAGLADELRLRPDPGVRFIFPDAPVRPVTLNGGMTMPAWYDLFGIDAFSPEDDAGIQASAAAIRALIDREVARGIDSRRVVLAGFSQGGALALYTGLRCPLPLGGIVGLSTYLPLAQQCLAPNVPLNPAPVFLAHGTADTVVPPALGEHAAQGLRARGMDVQWRTYPMAHAVHPAELADLSTWLTRHLTAAATPSGPGAGR